MTMLEEKADTATQGAVRTLLRMRVREGAESQFEEAWQAAAAQIAAFRATSDRSSSGTPPTRAPSSSRPTGPTGRPSTRSAVAPPGALTAALRDLREDADRSTYELLYGLTGGEQASHVRIDISTRVGPGEEEAFERAYAIVTDRLRGTPGLIREELLREPGSDTFHIFAEWESEPGLPNWVDDPSHADQTGPIIRWLSVFFERKLYEIRSARRRRGSGGSRAPCSHRSRDRAVDRPAVPAGRGPLPPVPAIATRRADRPARPRCSSSGRARPG